MKTVEVKPGLRYMVEGLSWFGISIGGLALVLVVWDPEWLGATQSELALYGLIMIVAGGVFVALMRGSTVVITEDHIQLPFARLLGDRRIVTWADIESVEDKPGGLVIRWRDRGIVRTYYIGRVFHRLEEDTASYICQRAGKE